MDKDSSIFGAYDIRGVFPEQLNADTAYEIGRAFAVFIGRKYGGGERPKAIAAGRDARLSSPELFSALVRGMAEQGADVVDIGPVSTDAVYFAVGKYGYDGGVMVTASHNPKEYNGFKMVEKGAVMLSGDEGIPEIRDMVVGGEFPDSGRKGSLAKKDIADDFAKHVLSFIDAKRIRPFRAIIDVGNGMAGKMLSPIARLLPCEIILINAEPDGNFPAHNGSPNTLLPGYADQLRKRIKEEGADFGAAFDGDADRMTLVDEKGNVVGGDMLLAWMAGHFLKKNKGKNIVYTVICSKSVPETIAEAGGNPIRSRVGSAFIKKAMRENGAVLAGEVSGHYYFKDNFYSDSGMVAFAVLLEMLSESGRPLSENIREMDRYVRTGEINIETDNKERMMEEIEERIAKKYPDTATDRLEGLTAEFPDWWFNIRPSRTEPLLRVYMEADNEKILEEKKKEIWDLLK